MGEPIRFRRRRSALPPQWARYARAPAFSAEQIRMTIWSGLLLGLILFQAMRYWPAPMEAAAPAPLEPVSASGPAGGSGYVRVIDGDTFDYAGARIRIADIDTPEVQGRCPEESALAVQATRRLGVLLAQGPFELHALPGGRDRDRYGRQLRIVTRGGRSLGDVLVAEGLARTWTGRREPWCV